MCAPLTRFELLMTGVEREIYLIADFPILVTKTTTTKKQQLVPVLPTIQLNQKQFCPCHTAISLQKFDKITCF